MRYSSIAAMVLALLLVTACGASNAPSAETPVSASAQPSPEVTPSLSETVAVAVQGFGYSPGTLTVSPGTTITWSNVDEILHTVTTGSPESPDGEIDGQMQGAGTDFTHTFSEPGTYEYFCSRHPFMRGTVIVQ